MSLALTLGCLWVLAAAVTAMMPMRRQVWLGLPLLATAPVLVVWIGLAHGWLWLVPALFAVLSMFRNPLIHLIRWARGERPEMPRDLRG